MRIDIVIFDGFDELDAIAPYEVLRTAEELGAPVHAELVGAHGAATITASHGARIEVGRGPAEGVDMLLDGRRATTHHTAYADLRAAGAEVVEERFVDEGDLMTAGGVTCGIDLALHIVEKVAGVLTAEQVAREIVYERR